MKASQKIAGYASLGSMLSAIGLLKRNSLLAGSPLPSDAYPKALRPVYLITKIDLIDENNRLLVQAGCRRHFPCFGYCDSG